MYNQATGEMIDVKPTWLQKLETKCENEKDKLHVVFFDEMTNALHSIQGMAFNIVLDREAVYWGFANSTEFSNIIKGYGL